MTTCLCLIEHLDLLRAAAASLVALPRRLARKPACDLAWCARSRNPLRVALPHTGRLSGVGNVCVWLPLLAQATPSTFLPMATISFADGIGLIVEPLSMSAACHPAQSSAQSPLASLNSGAIPAPGACALPSGPLV